MLNKSIKLVIENKLIIVFAVILVLILGAIVSPFNYKFSFLPNYAVATDAIPNLGENQQIVFTEWQGQSPQDIENQITYPLTSKLMGISKVKTVRSSSMFGYSMIYIIFEDNVDFYWARSRILEKLSTISSNFFPKGVHPELGPDATALGQVFWYTLEGRNDNGEVTGGWSLQELRSIQDFYVKNGLSSTEGVSEVASVGGFVKEYQIDVIPEQMRQYGISLEQVVKAIKSSNSDVGAQTIEINKAEYFVRGLGYINSIEDIESTSVVSNDFTPIYIRDIAKVRWGPAPRRGILDKGGAEVVGGVVTASYSENPMRVVANIKSKINEISAGLPEKVLSDGSISKLKIIPFYDRANLVQGTLKTLHKALWLEILITVLVMLVMLRNLKVALLISALLPVTVMAVFVIMKLFGVEANIVALSGIAIAIGTVVDMAIILSENIVRVRNNNPTRPLSISILEASKEVSGAIITAGLTTVISFIPVFSLTGVAGKLFAPLAFTKSVALLVALLITVFVIPPIAALVLNKNYFKRNYYLFEITICLLGGISLYYGNLLGLIALTFGILAALKYYHKISDKNYQNTSIVFAVILITTCLAKYWRPLAYEIGWIGNFLFVVLMIIIVLAPIYFLNKYYESVLNWILSHKKIAVLIPVVLICSGVVIALNTQKEFMPRLDEGEFLLMPTSLPHAGVQENNKVLKKLDIAVASIPEVAYVVGKAGRTSSSLDPAPLSMYENLIHYKSEYILDNNGNPMKFRVNYNGEFETKGGKFISSGISVTKNDLVPDTFGEYYRNWRKHIRSADDIWKEIIKVTELPGVTVAPKLQPIETRLVMLQTGMRSSLGIKIKGQNQNEVERFGLEIEKILKSTDGISPASVYADRVSGKPYLLFDIHRNKIAKYGLSIEKIQSLIEIAVGGKVISEVIDGRERYGIRVRYPRELRSSPEELAAIYVDLPNGATIPINELVSINYEKGPQQIKSEDGYLTSYVIFDKLNEVSEVTAVFNIEQEIQRRIKSNELKVPTGVNYEVSGTYKDHLEAEKTLRFVIPLCLFLIIIILYLQFKSIVTALTVFSSIAVAFAGGFILVWLFGQSWFLNINFGSLNLREVFNVQTVNLSVAVWVGFIALFGIATDDGVVMATYLNQSFNKAQPANIEDIRNKVIAAGKKRLRPCLMTTATTILALLPILTATGKGASIMIPMAIPCLGGMLMVLITLFVVPLLYCWREETVYNKNR